MSIDLKESLSKSPIISAIQDNLWEKALSSPSKVIFYLKANLMTVAEKIKQAHNANKLIFIHIDLAEGVGKDKSGVEFLAKAGADGIISTRSQLIKYAKEFNLLSVQRFFALDSQGVNSIRDMLDGTKPDLIEIMPGVIGKIIKRLTGCSRPVIAGGLIETTEEVKIAFDSGAIAVSTGNASLWEMNK